MRLALIAVTGLLALAAAGCGQQGAQTTENVVISGSLIPLSSGTPPPSAAATPPSCDPAAFLPVLKARLDDASQKLTIVRAKVIRCVDGYARVVAAPDRTVCQPGVGYCYDDDQAFLAWGSTGWAVLFDGSGISCSGESNAEVRRVCRALGYPG